mmetsp:Transcript_7025/g.22945  ORF Transcript_7025/g.22945 Transcript_7025/m.22945 type:complete len:1089 (+) Transcript_7025:61-3327(+)|eukprot:CAMPEP_0118906856 /NCGR_PEP_ID=MMETSP1166-20130328/10563_1 /TAXON_ID=1104430 /ORGANISM="Chrysoreinhardia sp, Strain CCMP3193" /LENGTH=1088 /DNA_ID=CAMNT_0006846213 /DNA_START=26 /DNA_END=3292 /DNA_ORIENTATION=+
MSSFFFVRRVAVRRALVPVVRRRTTKSWIPQNESELQNCAMTALKHAFTAMNLSTAETLIPWFLNMMPASYFRSVSHEDRLQHLRAISALRSLESRDDELRVVTAASEDERVVTFATTGNRPGLLLRQVQQLSREAGRLAQVQVFTSRDDTLCLNVYHFDQSRRRKSQTEDMPSRKAHEAFAVEGGVDDIADYLDRCTPAYLDKVSSERLLRQKELYERAKDTGEHVRVDVEKAHVGTDDIGAHTGVYWIQLAAPNVRPRGFLRRILKVLAAADVSVERAHLDEIGGPDESAVAMMRLLVTPSTKWDDDNGNVGHNTWDDATHLLQRLKFLDDATLDVALAFAAKKSRPPTISELTTAEVVSALARVAHARLASADALAYSQEAILDVVAYHPRYRSIATKAANDLVSGNGKVDVEGLTLKVKAATAGVDAGARRILDAFVRAAAAVRDSNLDRELRCSLALSFDPKAVLDIGGEHHKPKQQHGAVPYSIVFVHSRRVGGFHVRFRKIARGGMRLVTPPSREKMAYEAARHFDECYNLAFAQQLKNKDIAEGGSKGVLLVDSLSDKWTDDDEESSGETLKHFACRQAVKAYTDGILDLVLAGAAPPPGDTAGGHDDQHHRTGIHHAMNVVVDAVAPNKELGGDMIFLGPDEQILPEDIEWVVENAARRKHATPDAFMSSKPASGINHREFGVTSEGVVVFVEAALRSSGKDPHRDPFTVKITGGPDGDVAGNLIRFLIRDFPDTARIVGVADGSGCAEDARGLDHGELLRLVDEDRPIIAYALPCGCLADASDEDGASKRDSMHARVEADVFVPGGGRPHTLNSQNVDAYLTPDGRASAPIIVEGANLFLTPEARTRLFEEAGVKIVKDSSANKAGVICSSYEILAAHILDRSDFEQLKPVIVAEVVQNLRHLASLEAKLLFREFARYPGLELPAYSTRISKAINDVKDAVVDHFSRLAAGRVDVRDEEAARVDPEPFDLFRDLAPDHLPPTLAKYAVERPDRFPTGYVEASVASFVASQLVYSEGLAFVETLPRDRVAQIALDFVDAKRQTQDVLNALHDVTDLDDKRKAAIEKLLKRGGARAQLDL